MNEYKMDYKTAFFTTNIFLHLLLIGFLISFLKTISYKVILKEKVISFHTGLLSVKTEDIELYRVRDLDAHQSIFGRIFNFGKITIYSKDATAPIQSFIVENPIEYKDKMWDYVNKERETKNIRIEENFWFDHKKSQKYNPDKDIGG